jgi:Na+/melibiose symporter-like transporter
VFNFTIGPVLWTYVPNIIHPKFIPIVTFIHWIFSSVMLFVFPIAKQHLDSMYIFLFQATLGAAAMLINQVAMVDTNDRSHQEIKEEFDKLFTAE